GGVDGRRDSTAVEVALELGTGGRALAFASHLDVVPPGSGWTGDPFTRVVEGERLYGRGSGDAKAAVAAMLCAAWDLAHHRPSAPPAGRLLVILGYAEETRDTSMPGAVASLPPIEAAVVGEPTSLEAAIAQRGLMMADLVARGDQRHAGYAAEDGAARNAIVALARDLAQLDGIVGERVHPLLGATTVTPTMLQAG